MPEGKFIVFEGADGSGKTTQAKLLYEYISARSECILTAEPTDGPIGRLCRDIGAGRIKADADTQALLYAADRIEHIKSLMPELDNGRHVICDRYYISSLAYQSVYTDFESVAAYNRVPFNLLKPDITVFTDTPLAVCEKRRAMRKGAADIYETADYAGKVHEQYRVIINRLKESENIFIVDGGRSREQVFADIVDFVTRVLSAESEIPE